MIYNKENIFILVVLKINNFSLMINQSESASSLLICNIIDGPVVLLKTLLKYFYVDILLKTMFSIFLGNS